MFLKNAKKPCQIILLAILGLANFTNPGQAQDDFPIAAAHHQLWDELGNPDKCGFDSLQSLRLLKTLGDHWGYSYDSLKADLGRWRRNPFVAIDSIGASVQNRALWELTITDTVPAATPKQTVYIHARTHPGEVQSWWVTDEIINLLLEADEFASLMREKCVFHIIPMYNPDGVELELPRQNANNIDIESNWNKDPVQPEVAALRRRFEQLMTSPAPIRVALNMHSSVSCTRYFVFHDAVGTSALFVTLQKQFIAAVRSYFPDGIEPWNYFISWRTGTATQYPESWFWLNFRENVMALTYEDMNCPQAGDYAKTANALVRGVADYLGISASPVVAAADPRPEQFVLQPSYPNPFYQTTTLRWQQNQSATAEIWIVNVLGQLVTRHSLDGLPAGEHEFRVDLADQVSGVYFYQLRINDTVSSLGKMILLPKSGGN